MAGGPETVHIRVQQPQGPVRKGILQPDHNNRGIFQRDASDSEFVCDEAFTLLYNFLPDCLF